MSADHHHIIPINSIKANSDKPATKEIYIKIKDYLDGIYPIDTAILFAEKAISRLGNNASDIITKQTLIEFIGELYAEKSLLESSGDLEYAIVNEYNKRLFALKGRDRRYVLIVQRDGEISRLDFLNKKVVREEFQEDIFTDKHGNKRLFIDIWLESVHKRRYDNIVMKLNESDHDPRDFNLWTGYAVPPKKGDTEIFWKHMRENMCAGNEEHYVYVRKTLAYWIQYPDVLNVALIFIGEQGSGKGTFMRCLKKIYGRHAATLNSVSQLLTNFNLRLKDAVLLHLDEATWGGHKREIGKMKAMVTEKRIVIEGKGVEAIEAESHIHMILTSNDDWPVHIERDDRRFFPVRNKTNGWGLGRSGMRKLNDFVDGDGPSYVLYDLQNEDLTGFNPIERPYSEELMAIKLEGSLSSERYILEVMKFKTFDIGGIDSELRFDDDKKTHEFSWKRIHTHYKIWCSNSQETAVDAMQRFSKIVRKMLRVDGKYIYRNGDKLFVTGSYNDCLNAVKAYFKTDSL